MEFNATLFWQLFNLFAVILLVYILCKAYRKSVKKAELQYQREEAIINKLDELIRLNKNIIDHLSPK